MDGEKNVVIFGESGNDLHIYNPAVSKFSLLNLISNNTGSGKSSIVNLLLGKPVAQVSDRAVGCTFEFSKYTAPNYNLFDTVGLSEGSRRKKFTQF